MDKKEFKAQKKAYKKAKRRKTGLWKWLSIISAPVAIIMIVAIVLLSTFDNTVAAFVGGTFWQLENEDEHAAYYQSDFATAEEMAAYGIELCELVEAEGAALLMNENNALPLEKGSKVSLFSDSSVNIVYGGTGSGNIDASTANTLNGALTNAGLEVNDTLWNYYLSEEVAQYARFDGDYTSGASVGEIPWSVYPQNVLDSVASYGDAAIVTFSRVGGEGVDLSYEDVNYLALNEDEKAMMENLKALKDAGTIKKIIVLLNTANTLQVDFLKNNEYGVDACLWIGDVGISGVDAVGKILAGDITPSGSLVDTYLYDNYSSPAMQNFTPVTYDGYTEGIIPENASSYMIYQEGIYVGYKYYETRYEDYVMGTGNAGDYTYGDDVAFPFGYGLSYTEFEYSDMKVNYNASTDRFEVSVKVTNVGDTYSGKETVQVYAQSPYTAYDVTNSVEKASVALCGFGKTNILEPGAYETVTVYVDRRELASYDAYGAGTYILEDGDYYLTVATDAHNAVNNVLAAKEYTTASTGGRMDADGNAELAYKWNNPTFDATTYATSLNGTAIVNQLSESDFNLYSGNGGQSITYLTRNDWTGTFPTGDVVLSLTDRMVRDLQDIQYDPADYAAVEMPALGRNNGIKLVDMMGLDYDDPKWDDLLDQLTFDEMVSLIGDAFHWTMPVKSVEAPGTREENGPQGLTASLLGSDATQLEATAFTSEDVMAATFNTELMYEVGRVIGNNCVNAGIACLYGPGNNMHRTPYGGRNFEYYSEDAFLSGKISQYEVNAIQEKGVDVVMKHFALNDCEQDRIGLGVWLTEQAAREIYLKAFQAPFEYGDANGVMMAYTRWGTQWSGGNKNLVTGIMRGEWGSIGKSITDNVLTTYVNGVDGVLAGTTYFDAMMPYVTRLLPQYENDPVVVSAMREACHHNLYALVNSCGMNGVGANTTIKVIQPTVITIVMILACGFSFLFCLSLVLFIVMKIKFKKSEIYTNYKTAKAEYKASKKG